ncbi:MAG: M1 family metallopeptidase [Gemmatimonadota bacterium]|jgi:aminopeptidase N|nr:M1 family metallopeptidase [Gemmatimonadota bacterium]
MAFFQPARAIQRLTGAVFPALLLALCTNPGAAQQIDILDSGGPLSPERAAFDVHFYDIDLSVDPSTRSIEGSAATFAELVSPLRYLVLDLDTVFTITGVKSEPEGTPLRWEREDGRIRIDLGSEKPAGSQVGARVMYRGKPRVAPNAPWDGGFVWARTPSGQPWIATAVQGHGQDLFWPGKDHVSDKPDSVSIRVRVPEPLVVASNGALRGVESHADGTRSYHWFVSTPISAYNVALNIAPYREIRDSFISVSGDTVPVSFFVLPEDEARGREILPEFINHVRFHEKYLGPYPFRADKYGVVQTPHLGMEHQTIIAYGARFDRGAMTGGLDWGFDALHHHELSHEWWGNLVTNADWKDMWLQEGFATYMQALYAGELGGADQYLAYMVSNRGGFANRQPVAPRETRTAQEIYFDSGSDIYGKGAWVLHTLRHMIGDDAFFRALRRMAYPDPALEAITDGGQTRFATTDDFLHIAEEESGKELGWFFEVYLRQPALPVLNAERAGDQIILSWDVPGGLPFPMPVDVEVDGEVHSLSFPAGGAVRIELPGAGDLVLDPDVWVLRANQAPIVLPASR